jgi:hypothetical protein
MRYRLGSGSTLGLLLGVGLAVGLGLNVSAARADDAYKTASPASISHAKIYHADKGAKHRRSVPHRYFVEFRARNAASYGHMYVLYGRVNANKEIIESHIAGFFPAGDKRDCVNCSVVNWTIGHVVFVPGEMGASDGDLEEKYVLARFRVWVTHDEYKKVVGFIKAREKNPPMWNALWKNCVDFGRDVAEFMKLKVPLFIWMEPKDFVNGLREDNGVHHVQLPLKDAATSGHHTASRTPPLPPQRPGAKAAPAKPKKQPVASESAPAKPKKQPAAAASSKPKKQAAAKKRHTSETLASTGVAH